MNTKYARPELEQPLTRIAARVDAALEGLRGYGHLGHWDAAVSAVLVTQRAPRHQLRPQLVLLGNLAGGGPGEGQALERFAAGVELFHLFMLLHDDVMDHAALRRGKPTLHMALHAADPAMSWEAARAMAIVVGSAVSLLAMQHLAPGAAGGAGAARAYERILDAGFHAAAGQLQDLAGFRGLGDSEAALRRALVDKSAYHSFGAPFAAGLSLADAGADPGPALGWGERLGVAFQALDDLTDLITPPTVSGKDALRDLLEGRPSLPLLLLRERAAGDDRAFVESLAGRQVLELGDRAHLDTILERTGVLAASAERIRGEIEAAAAIAEAAGFPAAAREGMKVFEGNMLRYLDEVLAAARDPE